MRRMTRVEREAFRAWEGWFVDLLVRLREEGTRVTGISPFEGGTLDLTVLQVASAAGLKSFELDRVNLMADMPPIPTVWPEDYNLDFAREVIANLGA